MWSMGERVAEGLTSGHRSGEESISSQDDAGWYGMNPGVRIDDTGIWIRHASSTDEKMRTDLVPYTEIRQVRPILRRRIGIWWQVSGIMVWLIMGMMFTTMMGEWDWVASEELAFLAMLASALMWLTGWLIIPIIGFSRTHGVLALAVQGIGERVPGLVDDRSGEMTLLLRTDEGPFRYEDVHKLAVEISSTRQRQLTKTPATQSGDAGGGGVQPKSVPHRITTPEPAISGTEALDPSSSHKGRAREFSSRLDLGEELGRGGMATVFRARDRRLDREVAVKVLHESLLSDQEAVARFEREAKLIAGLEHPNLLGIYGVERFGEGRIGLVMPYVRGGTLRDLIRSTGGDGLEPAVVERITQEILKGLAFAHRRGVVHRDIKPGNIFLDEEADRVLIGDFGIARAAEGHTALTQTGTSMGTPNYMAPEQIDSSSEVDGRADLYAVGMMMWEMLTGEQPWGQESLFNVIFKQKTEDLETPRRLGGPVPDHLLMVWRKATRKDPDDRWATAEEMLGALAGASQGTAATPLQDYDLMSGRNDDDPLLGRRGPPEKESEFDTRIWRGDRE